MNEWYHDWQHTAHAVHFDGRSRLDRRNLIRNYESFNDVRMLHERADRRRKVTLAEIGCATGEFYRYLKLQYPNIEYWGLDISEPAIARARAKYPQARFLVNQPEQPLKDVLARAGLPAGVDVVYAKDVVHHQTQPFVFMTELLTCAHEAVIMRLRTRDVGPTELNPEYSCQHHYGGWMPYLVLNVQEVVDHIHHVVGGCEIIIYRNHMVLGGRINRFLPKACYVEATGTAETAVGVFFRTATPGTVHVQDRNQERPCYTWDRRLRTALGAAWRALHSS